MGRLYIFRLFRICILSSGSDNGNEGNLLAPVQEENEIQYSATTVIRDIPIKLRKLRIARAIVSLMESVTNTPADGERVQRTVIL